MSRLNAIYYIHKYEIIYIRKRQGVYYWKQISLVSDFLKFQPSDIKRKNNIKN